MAIQSTGSLSEKEGLVQSSESLADSTSRSPERPQFTPGPWVHIPPEPELDEDENETGAFVYPGGIEGADGNPVCTFGDSSGSATMFENAANPHLIAAAPDLYEALEMVRDADDEIKGEGELGIPPIARWWIDRALAKANPPSNGDREFEPERDAGDLNPIPSSTDLKGE